jgi:hypothetical protein
MSYIPPEAKAAIDQLESKVLDFESKNLQLEKQIKTAGNAKKSAQTGLIIVLVLFLAVLAAAGWFYYKQQLVLFPQASEIELKLQTQVDSLYNFIDQMPQTQSGNTEIDFSTGKWYFVQIGAYQKVDLSLYKEGMFNFRQSEMDGLYKYTLGAFQDVNQAIGFLEGVRKLGIRDAFLLAYVNGKKVTIEESKNL